MIANLSRRVAFMWKWPTFMNITCDICKFYDTHTHTYGHCDIVYLFYSPFFHLMVSFCCRFYFFFEFTHYIICLLLQPVFGCKPFPLFIKICPTRYIQYTILYLLEGWRFQEKTHIVYSQLCVVISKI